MQGYTCKFINDDGLALSIEKGSGLTPWAANLTVLLDRYDARHVLLDEPADTLPSSPTAQSTEEEVARNAVFDFERFSEYEAIMQRESEYRKQQAAGTLPPETLPPGWHSTAAEGSVYYYSDLGERQW